MHGVIERRADSDMADTLWGLKLIIAGLACDIEDGRLHDLAI
jgi:hypothetical protein